MRTYAITLLLAAAFGLISQRVGAAEAACDDSTPCCDQCGCHSACLQKTCQVVCEMKKETKSCWCVECTEICPLMPGCRQCCDDCPPPPRCGNPKTVKKLVKKEYQVEKPVYKCVVCNLCPECAGAAPNGNIPAVAPNPPPAPAPSADQSLPPMPPPPTRAPK
jgi:hypothetical protein